MENLGSCDKSQGKKVLENVTKNSLCCNEGKIEEVQRLSVMRCVATKNG